MVVSKMKHIFVDSHHVWEKKPLIEAKKIKIYSKKNPYYYDEKNPKKSKTIIHYWKKRYEYWPNFDNGICTDESGLYYVTPWDSAIQIANVCKTFFLNDSPIIIDCCCGVGGNTIAFARIFPDCRIIGIDNDSVRILCAQRNSLVSGCSERVDFLHMDCFNFLLSLRQSARFIFISPPWGGPGYKISKVEDIPFDLFRFIQCCQTACNQGYQICIFLPKNFKNSEALRLSPPNSKISKFSVKLTSNRLELSF